MLAPVSRLSPSMSALDLARAALAVGQERDVAQTMHAIQREAIRITRSLEAICALVDWGHGRCFTVDCEITAPAVHELLMGVAGGGGARIIGACVVAPIGRTPSRYVLAVRRLVPYSDLDLATIAALARSVAPAIERFAR